MTHKEVIDIIKRIHRYTDVFCVADLMHEINPVVEFLKREMWHKYPDEKPKQRGSYLVAYATNFVEENIFYIDSGRFLAFDNAVIAWREMPVFEIDVV